MRRLPFCHLITSLLCTVLVGAGLSLRVTTEASALPMAAGPEGVSAAVLPVPGPVLNGFSPPADPWLTGHRGVDLAAAAGAPVLAAAAGTVTYASALAGRGVVVVDHGAVRTTYEPVEPRVQVGQQVAPGDVLGVLQAGHASCAPASCLHWGARRGDAYLDPLLLPAVAQGPPVRLVGSEEVTAARRDAGTRMTAGILPSGGGSGPGGWIDPVPGPVTSPFGLRVHPVTGIRKLHDGVDHGAPCGTPIRAPLAGTVTEVVRHPAYGWRIRIDHGLVDGHHLVTSMNHAEGYSVLAGSGVQRGQVLGTVGSTGWSTGCHLHLMAWEDGMLIDPSRLE
ncbi:M23 family metallopeptidase [Raineyella fluvialis]|uniref:Peptidoglycan DD-metalloendopeptidase family protein n=1 Tax=Raineyella fluvialis TaxID=2662261 RepID=A0A5Q2FCX5_9ACTN|nr:peptidoglycan DD-metalloendopeptidase family protein [Raineyella fluvialis]QGF24950.1 peptidoglycan DD-metalloendopeptidase family protein [Raineyella fluvialis]